LSGRNSSSVESSYNFDTRNVPVVLTAGADGFLRLWRLVVNDAGDPIVDLVYELSLGSVVHDSSLQREGEVCLPVSAAIFDPVSHDLSAWVAFGRKPAMVKVNLATRSVTAEVRAHKDYQSASLADTVSSYSTSPNGFSCVIAHPTQPLVFACSADSNGGIYVFDSSSGHQLHSLAGHGGGVSGIAIDPSGMLLASCGVDGDVRVWSVDSRSCLWSTRAHRGKYGESALCIAFHPTRPALLVSAGADSLAKVFTPKLTQ
jgi:WD40 repeat protein